jgi:ABC-2 type transport system ATP-binding protein
MSNTAIQIKNVSVKLAGKEILKSITVDLPQGKIVGFIGPSGAGKTTLIRSIVGRQSIETGSITITGLPAGSSGLRGQISYMTQEVSVYRDLTVKENLRYFATMVGIPKKEIGAIITETLRVVDMSPQMNQVAASLSGGQKQRLSLAIALLGKPEFMVLDEPTVGLDPALREQLWRLFAQLASHGTTLIISSHVMDEAQRCDDLLLIREAKLLAHGTPEELCTRTHSKTVEESFLKLVGERQ